MSETQNSPNLDGLTDSIIIFIKDQDNRGQDFQRKLEDLGLSFEASDEEILSTIQPLVLEAFNKDIEDAGEWLFKVHRADDKNNIYIIPNSEAG